MASLIMMPEDYWKPNRNDLCVWLLIILLANPAFCLKSTRNPNVQRGCLVCKYHWLMIEISGRHISKPKANSGCQERKEHTHLPFAGSLLAEQNCARMSEERQACHSSHQHAGVHDPKPYAHPSRGVRHRHSCERGSRRNHAFWRERLWKVPFQGCFRDEHCCQEDRTSHAFLPGKPSRLHILYLSALLPRLNEYTATFMP